MFLVEGVGDTDGVHYAAAALGPRYPLGLLVVQNGEAPEPADTGPVNGYEFDGSTQFKIREHAGRVEGAGTLTPLNAARGQRSRGIVCPSRRGRRGGGVAFRDLLGE